MFQQIDPKTIDQNVFSLIGEKWMLITAGTAEQCNQSSAAYDRLLGRLGRDLGGPGGHLLYPPPAVYQGVYRPGGVFHPVFLWGGAPESPSPCAAA